MGLFVSGSATGPRTSCGPAQRTYWDSICRLVSISLGPSRCYPKVFVGSARTLSSNVAIAALTLNQRVQGSSPCAPTIDIKDLGCNLKREAMGS
jgi:hypothetical protein